MEIALANKLGVSRTPVREAIHKLEQAGLVMVDAAAWCAGGTDHREGSGGSAGGASRSGRDGCAIRLRTHDG